MTQYSNVVVCTWSEHYSIGNTVAGRQSTNLAPTRHFGGQGGNPMGR
jgi:hypothetical protein